MLKNLLLFFVFIGSLKSAAQVAADREVAGYMLQLQENVYLTLNKPYYYPSERVWVKAYMVYSDFEYRDSLSKVLYVEVISAQKKIMSQLQLKIQNGVAYGDFSLADSLQAGNYFVRAYTQWMRNYGDDVMPYFVVPVLEKGKIPVANQKTANERLSTFVNISNINNKEYTLNVGVPKLINFSLSITDTSLTKILYLNTYQNKIANQWPDNKHFSITHSIEKSLLLQGKIETRKKKNDSVEFSLWGQKSKSLFDVKTDKDGLFFVVFPDSSESEDLIASLNDNSNKDFSISLKNATPAINLPKMPYIIQTKSGELSIERDIFRTDGITLEQVKVKAKRETEFKLYQRPDAVIDGQTLIDAQVSNPILALQGRVPGISITEMNGKLQMDLRGSSKSFQKKTNSDPLILVDGVPFAISSLNDLTALDKFNIDKIEVVKSLASSSLYGSRAANGIIAFYTKSNNNNSSQVSESGVGVKTLKSPYFSRSNVYPNSVIQHNFWIPNYTVKNDQTTIPITFVYPATYRIELVGLLNDGNIVKCIQYVTVN